MHATACASFPPVSCKIVPTLTLRTAPCSSTVDECCNHPHTNLLLQGTLCPKDRPPRVHDSPSDHVSGSRHAQLCREDAQVLRSSSLPCCSCCFRADTGGLSGIAASGQTQVGSQASPVATGADVECWVHAALCAWKREDAPSLVDTAKLQGGRQRHLQQQPPLLQRIVTVGEEALFCVQSQLESAVQQQSQVALCAWQRGAAPHKAAQLRPA